MTVLDEADFFSWSWRGANTWRTSTPTIKSSTHVSTPTPTEPEGLLEEMESLKLTSPVGEVYVPL